MAGKVTRRILTVAVLATVAGGVALSFRPSPELVDLAEVTRAPMQLTVDAEGKTNVHDVFTVSTPIAGRILRLGVEVGDPVEAGKTVLARILPADPALLDMRARKQAIKTVIGAEAALRAAQAEVSRCEAELIVAQSDLDRTRRLHEKGNATHEALQRDEADARSAEAGLETAKATVIMRKADLDRSRAELERFDAPPSPGEDGVALKAPITGTVLKVMEESETILAAGTAVLDLGDVRNDLEVTVPLLSADAVKVKLGMPVLICEWGGEAPLTGRIVEIAPVGWTKTTALGVEEQRVDIRMAFDGDEAARAGLGAGYRIEARVILWSDPAALQVPSTALVRDGGAWVLFTVREGRAHRREVRRGRDNGVDAQLLEGPDPGTPVVLYPPPGLADGMPVAERQAE
ncbi:HlyD family efflux transporter periplasmic adaptor subunit [Rhodovulum sulfidophilum]|uniref:efflux RND transporter periplasmic adaptor subunit n=1 Tax=Rhodovulum sulfidophilum TaxID=35806 RepID=UPI0019234DE4|nr:HlyD family efflux transporter periplasmic adaptor subunit [Rhodovulum sulfidophilum]MBL3564821.1 HlyD family efflux transporter periplasmic adaptor subunit [Rhodovulum sulfidophilum]